MNYPKRSSISAQLLDWAMRLRHLCSGFIFSRRLRDLVIPILLALFPIALTLRITRRNWTSVPYGDDWYTPGSQIISFLHGSLRFADLFQQHNESRPLFPRLYYLFLFAATGRWDPKDAMVLTFALACLGSLLLYILLQRTTSFNFPSRLWACAFLNAVFFCPAQYEDFLWSIILVSFIPGVALLAAVLVNLSELRFRWKVLANSALALSATYSFANGMLLWVLAVPIYTIRRSERTENSVRKSSAWYGCYALLGALSVVFYFHHYVHPAHHPPFAVSFSDTMPLLRFLLSWLGNLFVVPGADPLFFGCFFLGLFVVLTIVAIRVARRQRTFRCFYPWVVIAAYALASGAIVASGRLGFGIGPALAARYAPVRVFFYIGLAGLALSLYNVWVMDGNSISSRTVFATGLTIGLFSAGWLSSFNNQLARVKVVREERKDLALAVQWIPAIPLNPDLALAKVPSEVVAEKATALSKYDAMRPRLISPSLTAIVRENRAEADSTLGVLETGRFTDDHRLLVTGTAWLPYRNGRPDCIVVGYMNENGSLTPFTVFQPTYKRERLKGRLEGESLASNGFAASIDPANLPTGELILRAWAVDMRAKRALPMAGAIAVHNAPIQKD